MVDVRDGWSTTHLVREVGAHLFSARARGRPLVLLAVLLGALQVAVLAMQERALVAELARLHDAGRNVVVIAAADRDRPARIDEESCRRLGEDPAVVRAGALGAPFLRDFVQLGAGVTVVPSSPGLFPELRSHDAVIGATLADVTGERILQADDGTVLEATVGPRQPTGIDTGYAVVVPGEFDGVGAAACVVVLDAFADAEQLGPVLVAQVSSTGGPIGASPPRASEIDPVRAHLTGLGRYLPVAWGCVLALVCGVLTLARAGELAAYRFAGTSPRSLALLLALEHLAVGGVVAASGSLAAVATWTSFRDPVVPVLHSVVSASVFVALSLVLTVATVRKNPVDLAKDR